MMKKNRFLVVLVMLAACAPQRNATDLHNILRTAVEQKRIPGVVAMVATSGGIVYEGAFGFNKDTIFAIASMTKPITSVAVMQLVEAGRLSLDEPATTYLPELGKVQVLGGSSLRAPIGAITVRQLLTHTSGFGYEFMSAELRDFVAHGNVASQQAGGDGFLRSPLLHDPGVQWEYGISTDWLGRLVERVTHESLEAYFRLRIFGPLGMPDTYFNVPVDKQSRLAARFHRTKDGDLAKEPPQPQNPVEFFSGGGGLYSTAADYLTFARAILAGGQLGGRRILRAETVADMGRNQIGSLTLHPFSSVTPELMVDGINLPGGIDKFGLGFALNSKTLGSGRGANTMSWAGIFNTFFWIDREKKICAVIMSQMSPFEDSGPLKTVEEFDRAVYAWLK
jgi:methyl acetate hydrolase